MNTLLLTGYNEKFKPLANITVQRLFAYANQHELKFTCHAYVGSMNPYWQKVRDILRYLPDFDRILWMDCDQLVTNMDFELPAVWSGAHFSMDWGQDATGPECFSACGFLACSDSLPLFEWIESVHDQYADGPFPEQTPMRLAYTENRFPGKMHVHSRRLFNAVPIEVHPTVVEPWQPGDFCAHVTMASLTERVAIAQKILERL